VIAGAEGGTGNRVNRKGIVWCVCGGGCTSGGEKNYVENERR
jgi:hypothetical protein